MTTQPHHLEETATDALPNDLGELIRRVRALPLEYREQVEPSLERVVDFTRRRRRILSLIQDALTQLRLDMKYMLFDLEATRRERDELRRKLESDAG
jgi:nitric oxide reductase activation protein